MQMAFDHFDRVVYFRIFDAIMARLNDVRKRAA
jgi:hypothetical protein